MTKAIPPFIIVFLVYFIFVVAEYCLLTYFALKSTSDGYSATFVGLFSLFLWVGIILSITQAHVLSKRFGRPNVLFYSLICAMVVSILAIIFDGSMNRLFLSFFLGVCGGLLWVMAESWVAESAPPGKRGLTVGLFETTVGIGLMLGPGLIPLLIRFQIHPPHFISILMAAAVLASIFFNITHSSNTSPFDEVQQTQISTDNELDFGFQF